MSNYYHLTLSLFPALVGNPDKRDNRPHRDNPDVQDRDQWPTAHTAGLGDWAAVSA